MNRFREALEQGKFVITCESIPGRGAGSEPSQEKAISTAEEIYATGRVDAISITDNPGGNPAILAEGISKLLAERGVCTLTHFTCKDRNRNQILSQLYNMEREGIENVLFMTGDYQVGGWKGRARPNFDLDSVQIQALCRELNEGLEVQGRKGPINEQPTHFFAGGVVNPYKYRVGETVPQYLKMEKKILSGARFLIMQLGYDARKTQECLKYLQMRGYNVPVIANVFVATFVTAKLMRAGKIAGCHVSDAYLKTLEEERKSEDKGRAARVERAAQMVAVAKGIGCAGVHIGGFGVDAGTVVHILDRAAELEDNWRDYVIPSSFPEPKGYYFFEPELDANGKPTGLNSDTLAPQTEDISGRKLFKSYRLSRFFHYWILTLDKRFNKCLARSMDKRDKKHGVNRSHRIEHTGKAFIYGCLDCGDCGLEATIYSCPMAQCPKSQRNGPCGGSMDGWCEVYPNERYCIWYKAYHRLARYDEMWRIESFITPPNNWDYYETSAWSNYTHRRDNAAHRVFVSLGQDGAPGGKVKSEDKTDAPPDADASDAAKGQAS
ncbi:MAG: methylenetetrahydrofolate reductase C-terminal domain-containing protein [Coriobacteriales bacterium]|jgi:methylenetetrahydrofolate reductase (NADPH)